MTSAGHLWRRLRQNFGIRAPQMSIRTRLPWWGRGAIIVGLVAVIGGMWWWGFDFGQIFGGFNRKEIETRIASLETEAVKLRGESSELRARNSTLESDLAMAKGVQEALTKQTADVAADNAQLKEEIAFLQKLLADSSKQFGLSIPRLSVDKTGSDAYRFSLIVVRGGNPKDEFEGNVTLQATVLPAEAAGGAPVVITVPEDAPGGAVPLKLKFKYYQKVEGGFRVPSGGRLQSLTARAYEHGNGSPRVTRTLTNP